MDDDECLLIDVKVTEGNRDVYHTKHILSNKGQPFTEVVLDVLTEYARDATEDINLMEVEEDDDGEDAINAKALGMHGRIRSIKCVGKPTELFKYLQHSNLSLNSLNSATTPIYKNGICIDLVSKRQKPRPPKDKKNLPNAHDLLMGRGAVVSLKFLHPPAIENSPTLDQQIKAAFIPLLETELGIGYFNTSQKECLEINIGTMVRTLCFFEKHWYKLLNKQFPNITIGKYSDSLLLELLSKCKRAKAKAGDDRLTVELLGYHCGKLSELNWTPFKKATSLADPLLKLKEEIDNIRVILFQKKSAMIRTKSIFSEPTTREPSAFKNLPSYVSLDNDNDEFFVSIPPATSNPKSKNQGGRHTTRKMVCLDSAIDNLTTLLKHKNDYAPMFLTDDAMGISDEALADEGGTITLEPSERAIYRRDFKNKLAKGLNGVRINVFGRLRVGSSLPFCIYVWKVPLHQNSDEHPGNVQRAIESCRAMLPKAVSTEAAKQFNNIMATLLDVPAGVRKALKNILFTGEVNVTGDVSENYCTFVMNLAAGLPIDESLIVDGRSFNSRGGKGIGSTK